MTPGGNTDLQKEMKSTRTGNYIGKYMCGGFLFLKFFEKIIYCLNKIINSILWSL